MHKYFGQLPVGTTFLHMSCRLCQEDVPLHSNYLEGAWTLICRLCDFQDDDQDQVLEAQPTLNLGDQPLPLSIEHLTDTESVDSFVDCNSGS